MVRFFGIVRKMRSIFHSQLSPLVRMSLLLVATLVGGSCSNGNDEGPSHTDDIEAMADQQQNPVIAEPGKEPPLVEPVIPAARLEVTFGSIEVLSDGDKILL